MAANNNMGSYSQDRIDIAEMRRAALPQGARLLVWRAPYNSTVHSLLEVRSDTVMTLKTYNATVDGRNSVSPERLKQVIADVKELAPTSDMGLVFWSHSSGWMQRTSRTSEVKRRGFGLESGEIMSITDLADALKGNHFSFIWFDSCFMGTVEVMYQLRHVADYIVASPTETPWDGMPYHLTLPLLFAADAPDLRGAIDVTYDYDMNTLTDDKCPVTLTLTDCSQLDALADATADVYASANPLPDDFDPQLFARPTDFKSETTPYPYIFFDFDQYVETIASSDALLAQWRTAFGNAVLYEVHSPMIWDTLPINRCCGLTTFAPSVANYDLSAYGYDELEWTKYTITNTD
jgi:hypothetical protein